MMGPPLERYQKWHLVIDAIDNILIKANLIGYMQQGTLIC